MRHGKIASVTASLALNAKNLTLATSAPSSPGYGDLWQEMSNPHWIWWWDGTYWRSPMQQATFSLSNATAQAFNFFPVNADFNYFFRRFRIVTFNGNAQTAANHWLFTLERRNSGNTKTTISTLNTNGNSAGIWVEKNTAPAMHLNVASTGAIVFDVDASPVGSPGSISAGIEILYDYARS